MNISPFLRAAVLFGLLIPAATAGDWVDLFDGETLMGWERNNGQAIYQVVGGAIVGRTAEGSVNSFLCTVDEYGDFHHGLLVDAAIYRTHPRGLIGLQAHRIRAGTGPYEVAWRNIRIRTLD